MSETTQIVLGLVFLVAVYVLTRYGVALRMKRACDFLIKDLERKEAFDSASAAELPYARVSFIRIGMRDFRPKALESMIEGDIVGKTAEGRYYLKKRWKDLRGVDG